jgi:hypothetical protein
MDFNEQINRALVLARERRFEGIAEEQLRSMLGLLHKWYDSQRDSRALPAIESIEYELSRRQIEKGQAEARSHHAAAVEEGHKVQGELKKLQHPHWTLIPTFWISLGILIVSIAVLVVALLTWLFPRDAPAIPTAKPAKAQAPK